MRVVRLTVGIQTGSQQRQMIEKELTMQSSYATRGRGFPKNLATGREQQGLGDTQRGADCIGKKIAREVVRIRILTTCIQRSGGEGSVLRFELEKPDSAPR